MKRWVIFFVIFVCCICLNLTAQQKKVLTYDEIIQLYRISDVKLSPDGSQIVFTATKYSYETDKGNSDLWIVPAKGGEAKQITFDPKADHLPEWSPDGSKIAFISSRNGAPQIYTLTMDFGEPEPVTNIPTGVTGLKWSHAGTHIIFTSEIYEGCTDMECNEKRVKEEKEEKVTAKVIDHLLFRHWNFWKVGKVSHLFSYRLSDGMIADLTPGDHWIPFGPFSGNEEYNVSPDGTTVAFSKRTGNTQAWDTNDDIYTVPIDGGELTQITTSKGSDTNPVYTPDGLYLSYIQMKRPGFEADKRDIILVNLKTGENSNITDGYDGSVREYVWAPDNRTIYFTSDSQGRVGIYKVDIRAREVVRLYQNGVCSNLNISKDGSFLIYGFQNSTNPLEIFNFDLKRNNPIKLTSLNESVISEIEMNPAEDVNFRGAGGDMIHGFIVKPPFFDKTKKYPMIYIIHGGPQGATHDDFHYRWNLQAFAARGYVVASINFHGSTGYGQKFVDSITNDWGGLPYRDLMMGIEYLVNKYSFIDGSRIAAAGASYGGYMIDWMAGHTEQFKCLVSHAGVYDLTSMYGTTEELWFAEWEYRGTPWSNPANYRKLSPSSYAKRFKTPTLVVHGEIDFRVPVSQGIEFFTTLQRLGVESRFIYYPDEGHFVAKPNNARFWYNSVLDWIDKYLKK